MAYAYRELITDSRINKSKLIVAPTQSELDYKIVIQRRQWEAEWQRLSQKQRQEQIKRQGAMDAYQATVSAENLRNKIENLLKNSLGAKCFDFEWLKDHTVFDTPKPTEPTYWKELREPLREDEEFNPKPKLLTKMFKKEQFIKENDANYERAHQEWIDKSNALYENNTRMEQKYLASVQEWEKKKAAFEEEKKRTNDAVDDFKTSVFKGDADAVSKYIKLSLNEMIIPIQFETAFDVEYIPENKTVIIDARFPTVDNMPKLKSVTYVKTKQETKRTFYSDAQIKKQYDDAVYQIVLTLLNRAFAINKLANLISTVALNGIVNTIDKTTGNAIMPCILSVRVNREDFEILNLSAIDPKAWFRKTKGVAAADIATVTPVQPTMKINKSDKRFIEGHEVINEMTQGDNLAAIDWQDFENLVREIFEEEFRSASGEVKITRASRDGGVDAVAFDPDPIRGGKIIIQAKRYTNVVGVSAVRDLYGTLLNEGAMKGILVTTSYYGNDAYDFANGKPIQLIDGGGLLALLEKHGHKARIDLKEAKQILKE